jgi:hypothetical protein
MIHTVQVSELEIIHLLGRQSYVCPVVLDVEIKAGDYVQMLNQNQSGEVLPELRSVVGCAMVDCRPGYHSVLIAPETLMRQAVLTNADGRTSTFWVGDVAELKPEARIALASRGEWMVHSLGIAVAPEHVPAPARVAILEEVYT